MITKKEINDILIKMQSGEICIGQASDLIEGMIEDCNSKDKFRIKIAMEDRQLVKDVASEKQLLEVVFSTDDVKIYTVYGNDEFAIKYPYRSIFMYKGNWQRACQIAPTLDTALLIYLEHKYLGLNSNFTNFAIKMLEIKT